MWKYNLYMNEICNVHYLIAKFKFNPFKYSYVIFYDLSWLCAHLCIHRALFLSIWVLPFFPLLNSTKNKVDEELYGEKQEKNGNDPFFSLLSSLLQLSGKFNIHHPKYGAAATVQNKETERNFYKKSYYHLWGFKKRYFILLVYNLLTAVYLPLSTGSKAVPKRFHLLYHVMTVLLALYSFVWCFFQLCAILLLFSLSFPNVSFSLSGFVISLMHANYIPTFFMRIIWPL